MDSFSLHPNEIDEKIRRHTSRLLDERGSVFLFQAMVRTFGTDTLSRGKRFLVASRRFFFLPSGVMYHQAAPDSKATIDPEELECTLMDHV